MFDQKLKQKISQESEKYDFKLIQKQFSNAEDSSVYLTNDQLNFKIKDESSQGSAEKMLNIW